MFKKMPLRRYLNDVSHRILHMYKVNNNRMLTEFLRLSHARHKKYGSSHFVNH